MSFLAGGKTLLQETNERLLHDIETGRASDTLLNPSDIVNKARNSPNNAEKARCFMLLATASYACKHAADGDRYARLMRIAARESGTAIESLNKQMAALSSLYRGTLYPRINASQAK